MYVPGNGAKVQNMPINSYNVKYWLLTSGWGWGNHNLIIVRIFIQILLFKTDLCTYRDYQLWYVLSSLKCTSWDLLCVSWKLYIYLSKVEICSSFLFFSAVFILWKGNQRLTKLNSWWEKGCVVQAVRLELSLLVGLINSFHANQ